MRWLPFFGSHKSVSTADANGSIPLNDAGGSGAERESDSADSALPTLDYIGSACQLVLGYSGKHTDGYSGYFWNGEG